MKQISSNGVRVVVVVVVVFGSAFRDEIYIFL